jgi:very-short-patch-repair endonuclease
MENEIPAGRRGVRSLLGPQLLERARTLRQEQTDAEALLWMLLRNRRLRGFKFRRQHPIEPYILDFYCEDVRLAVELDGGQHNTDGGRRRDAARTAFLAHRDIRVNRYWNYEVLGDTETVLEAIYQSLIARETGRS